MTEIKYGGLFIFKKPEELLWIFEDQALGLIFCLYVKRNFISQLKNTPLSVLGGDGRDSIHKSGNHLSLNSQLKLLVW